MEFDISHPIDAIDVADYERLYFDEPFNEALCLSLRLSRRLVRLEHIGGRIVREVEVAPDREVPAAVRKLLGGTHISYTETIHYTLGSGQGTWSTVSSVLADKIKSDGVLQIAPAQSGGITRRVQGHVTVRIFGLGKIVEKFIVNDVTGSYEQAAAFTQTYLAAKGAPKPV